MTGRVARPYETRPYVADKKHLAQNLTDRALKRRLCDLGPFLCARCRLCTFGIEYLNRSLPVEGVNTSE